VENLSGTGLFFFGSSNKLLQFPCVLQICLGGKFPLGSILGGHMFLEICPFLLDFPIY
jgi:hypothetical protein